MPRKGSGSFGQGSGYLVCIVDMFRVKRYIGSLRGGRLKRGAMEVENGEGGCVHRHPGLSTSGGQRGGRDLENGRCGVIGI